MRLVAGACQARLGRHEEPERGRQPGQQAEQHVNEKPTRRTCRPEAGRRCPTPYHRVLPARLPQQTTLHGLTQGEPVCGVVVAMPPGDHAHSPPVRGGRKPCRRELDDALAVSNLTHTWMKT